MFLYFYSFRFIFPFKRAALGNYDVPKNCIFIDMNWNSGLKEYAINAKFVFVPSLNSAPIESALIKSIFFTRAVCVVDINNAFSNEIENNVILKLPRNLDEASKIFIDAFDKNWSPDKLSLERFIKNHAKKNKKFLDNINIFLIHN